MKERGANIGTGTCFLNERSEKERKARRITFILKFVLYTSTALTTFLMFLSLLNYSTDVDTAKDFNYVTWLQANTLGMVHASSENRGVFNVDDLLNFSELTKLDLLIDTTTIKIADTTGLITEYEILTLDGTRYVSYPVVMYMLNKSKYSVVDIREGLGIVAKSKAAELNRLVFSEYKSDVYRRFTTFHGILSLLLSLCFLALAVAITIDFSLNEKKVKKREQGLQDRTTVFDPNSPND